MKKQQVRPIKTDIVPGQGKLHSGHLQEIL